jgi:succinate dehydrogenase flavin-adding protein (antitoxin of CptAB toxin-antitoxin module)
METTKPKTENGNRMRKVTISLTERQFKAMGLLAEYERESIEETLRGSALRDFRSLLDSGDGEFAEWMIGGAGTKSDGRSA